MKKLAIVSSHPIQYNAPFFKLLSARSKIDIKVFYTWSQAIEKVQDKNFGKEIAWDIPLLEGYNYSTVQNYAKNPGTAFLFGFKNPELLSLIGDYAPDAILVYGWFLYSHLQTMRYFKGKIPVIFRGDSTLIDDKPGIKTTLRRLFLKWIYSHIDYALYVGTKNKEYFLIHGVEEKKLVFGPHAIDNERFSSEYYETEAIQKRIEMGYSDDDIVILFAGKFTQKKNPLILIKAVKELNAESQKPLKLLFVGDGILENQIRQVSQNDDNIKIIPFQNQSQMPVVYRTGDIFSLPSSGPEETWGLGVNEAMASGRAVLTSDKAGCSADLVKDGFNGYTFESGNIDDLKRKLMNIISKSKAQLRQMGGNSSSLIKDWNYEQLCLAIENIMRI